MGQRTLALEPVPLALVADLPPQLFPERLQQVEGDVRRLEMLEVRAGDVIHQRAQRRAARHRHNRQALRAPCRIETGQHPRGH